MRRSKIVAPMHFVWASRGRLEVITPEIETALYRCICSQAETMDCEVIAIGGMPDHVHLAVMFSATVSFSQFVKQIKGATSRLMKETLPLDSFFYWQEGYGVFGFHKSLIPRVAAYIRNQKQHHAENTLWPALEAVDELVPESRA